MNIKKEIEKQESNWGLFEPNTKIFIKKGIHVINETIKVKDNITIEGES